MDNKSTTKRMIGAVVLVLIAALLLAWLLKGKNQSVQQQQELIADQTTQGSTPILGFPGVKEGEEAAQNGDGDAPYVIGDADAKQDDTAAQQGEQTAQTTDDGKAEGVVAAGAGVVAGAATAGKEAVQNLANNFQVRDSDEQRQVVDDGKAKAGTGSMGSSELALPNQGETATKAAAGDDATQQQAQAPQTQTAEKADDTKTEPAPAAQTQQTQAASSGNSGSAAQDKQPVEQKKPAANVKLVGEKAVPAPRSQSNRTASSSSSSSSKAASASSSSSASSSAARQTATGGRGYAIQVLAASSRNKAEQVRKSIAVDGYPVFVVRANVNGKTVYRVRVGTYPARNAARSVQTKMKARYTKNQYVQNSFVTKN